MVADRNQKWYSYQKKWSHFAGAIKILMRKCEVALFSYYFHLPQTREPIISRVPPLRLFAAGESCLLGQGYSRSAGPSSGPWWEGGRCQRSTFPPPVSWLLHDESNSRLHYPSSVTSARRALPHLAVGRSVLAPTGGKQLRYELLLPDASARK